MKEERSDETFFRELMAQSKLTFPFPDFDDKVMRLVESGQKKRNNIQRDLRLSWVFFLLGSAFGIVISILLPEFQGTVFGFSIEKFTIPFQILFTFLFVTQLNNLIYFYNKTRYTKR